MGASSVYNVDGSTLTFATSGWTAQLTSVGLSGVSRDPIETSHLGLAAPDANKFANATFIPSKIVDGGTLDIAGTYNPNVEPPVDDDPETLTWKFPLMSGESTQAEVGFTGFMTNFSVTGAMKGKYEFSASVKISGNISITDAT